MVPKLLPFSLQYSTYSKPTQVAPITMAHQPNADATYTLPDGHVIDLSKGPPAGGPGPDPGPRGPKPATGSGG